MSLNGALKVAGQHKGLRMIAGRVDVSGGVPSVGEGAGFSVVDVAAGKVKVVFKESGRKIVSFTASPIEATDTLGHSAKVLARTEASDVTVGIHAADGTDGVLADNVGFYFQALVKDYK